LRRREPCDRSGDDAQVRRAFQPADYQHQLQLTLEVAPIRTGIDNLEVVADYAYGDA
jgi:hypothetical protein